MAEVSTNRGTLAQRGRRLELFTILWNGLEGLVGVVAGWLAGSISLTGFGFDSFIEVASGAALLWRMAADADPSQRKHRETRALRVVGASFVVLAIYVCCGAISDLFRQKAPQHSQVGIVLACVSLIVMPLLSRAKRKVGAALGSAAMTADAKQAQFCAYLSAILLAGLLLNAVWGLWWADPAAALIMAPIIARQGVAGLRGDPCCD